MGRWRDFDDTRKGVCKGSDEDMVLESVMLRGSQFDCKSVLVMQTVGALSL